MKKPFSISELSLKVLRIAIGAAIAVSVIGYYMDISQTSTIVIQGIPESPASETASETYSPEEPAMQTADSLSQSYSVVAESEPEFISPVEAVSAEIYEPEIASAPITEQTNEAAVTTSSQVNQTEIPKPETPSAGFININTATAAELMELEGIGEVKAAAIIEYRREHGDFKSADELTNVSGIGEKTLEKNRDRITI